MARRGRTFSRGPRRATDWSASAFGGIVVVANGTAVLLETFAPIVGGETVIRTRGNFSIASDQDIATELQIGAFGICVVTQQAAGIGITAIPHPVADAAWGGWLYHRYFAFQFDFGTGVGFISDMAHQIEIDSKAMRKVDEDDRLVTLVENNGSRGFQIVNHERFLSKVH